jgi:hypothetical protein
MVCAAVKEQTQTKSSDYGGCASVLGRECCRLLNSLLFRGNIHLEYQKHTFAGFGLCFAQACASHRLPKLPL